MDQNLRCAEVGRRVDSIAPLWTQFYDFLGKQFTADCSPSRPKSTPRARTSAPSAASANSSAVRGTLDKLLVVDSSVDEPGPDSDVEWVVDVTSSGKKIASAETTSRPSDTVPMIPFSGPRVQVFPASKFVVSVVPNEDGLIPDFNLETVTAAASDSLEDASESLIITSYSSEATPGHGPACPCDRCWRCRTLPLFGIHPHETAKLLESDLIRHVPGGWSSVLLSPSLLPFQCAFTNYPMFVRFLLVRISETSESEVSTLQKIVLSVDGDPAARGKALQKPAPSKTTAKATKTVQTKSVAPRPGPKSKSKPPVSVASASQAAAAPSSTGVRQTRSSAANTPVGSPVAPAVTLNKRNETVPYWPTSAFHPYPVRYLDPNRIYYRGIDGITSNGVIIPLRANIVNPTPEQLNSAREPRNRFRAATTEYFRG
jgi:hypothetical protein